MSLDLHAPRVETDILGAPSRDHWSRRLLWGGILIVLTAIAYYPATRCGFIWDDDDYVTENPTLRDAEGLASIWLKPSATPQYYPLVHTTFWLEYQAWGLNPTGYHITNILLHAINAVLLWRLLFVLKVPGAWLAAVIFAVHPVHVESVAWVTERKNVLSGGFYLLSLLALLRYWNFAKVEGDEDASNRRWVWYAIAHLFFVAALLSKTITATLPAVILVLIWWKRGAVTLKHFIALVPMFVIGISSGLITVWLEKYQVGASGMDWNLSPIERTLIAGRALWFYACKLAWPTNLIFTYPRWDIDTGQAWQFLFPITAIGLMVALWLLRERLGRGPLAAVLIFAGSLFPALGFLDVYPMRFSFVADHFQYLASISLVALATSMASNFAAKQFTETRSLATMAVVCVTATLMGLTWQQTKIYEGLEVLWRDTIARNPSSFMAHNNLGALLNRRGDYPEAETHLIEAMTLKPDFVDAVVNRGKAREGQGDFADAEKFYRRAVEMQPNFAPALNGLGAMLGAQGDLRAARQMFERAIESQPSYVSARINLARIYQSEGKVGVAIEQLQTALQLQPESANSRDSLVQLLMSDGRIDEAKSVVESSLIRDPTDVNLLGALGVIAANQDDYKAAIGYFERILELAPGEPNASESLTELRKKLNEVDQAR